MYVVGINSSYYFTKIYSKIHKSFCLNPIWRYCTQPHMFVFFPKNCKERHNLIFFSEHDMVTESECVVLLALSSAQDIQCLFSFEREWMVHLLTCLSLTYHYTLYYLLIVSCVLPTVGQGFYSKTACGSF